MSTLKSANSRYCLYYLNTPFSVRVYWFVLITLAAKGKTISLTYGTNNHNKKPIKAIW